MAEPAADISHSFAAATQAHRAGRLDEAARLYRQVLVLEPRHAGAINYLGGIAAQQGDFAEAERLIAQALQVDPNAVPAYFTRGGVLQRLGRLVDAVAAYDEVIARIPDMAEAWNNRGAALNDLNRTEDALASYDRALAIRPDYAEAWCGRALALARLRRADAALAACARAEELAPGLAAAQTVRFKTLVSDLKDHDAAVRLGRELARRSQARATPTRDWPEYRLQHDREQRDYLAARGVSFQGPDQFARALHFSDPAAPIAAALNPANDWAEIERRYFGRTPEIVVIDDLLAPAALAALRAFCLESTVWKRNYGGGYLGAFAREGFISALHLQIGRELQQRMPRIFGALGLEEIWAFKYDASMETGIGIHADAAQVNLNFWITPDDACLDPNSGGLKVYDVPSPREWSFREYNDSEQIGAIRQFLADNNANCITAPYRCNRAVLFNSTLFHETDTIRFKSGYENRRINVTYLFGRALPG